MSKTGEWIVSNIESLANETGYPFRFLMGKYFATISALESIGSESDPMSVLKVRARDGEFVIPNDYDKDAGSNASEKPNGQDDKNNYAAPNGFGYIIHQPIRMMEQPDIDTTKIRKHTHDTLWAVLAGFIAGGVLFTVFGMIVIGILSYARG